MGRSWLTKAGQESFYCNRSRLTGKAGRAEGETMAIPSQELSQLLCANFSHRETFVVNLSHWKNPKQQHNSKQKSIFSASSFLQPISSQFSNLFLIFCASFPHGFRVVFPANLPTNCIFQAPLATEWNIWEGREKLLANFTLQWTWISFMVCFIKYH